MLNFSTLLVGPPGAGKTTAAATASKFGPVLFLDMDNKIHKMENLQGEIAGKKIYQWIPEERLFKGKLGSFVTGATNPQAKFVQQRAKGYQKLAERIDELEANSCMHEGVKMATIVLDSFTSVEEHLKRLLMSANGVSTISLPLYGTVLTNYENLLSCILNLKGVNIIIIAHQRPTKDDLTGVISYTPLISGQMKDKIGKDFEEVYYLEKTVKTGVAKYEMLTVGSAQKPCRTSRILEARVEPDFGKIYK